MSLTPESILARFAVKNVKTLSSRAAPESAPFEASLYFDGKRLAHVSDTGWGGAFDYDYSASGGRRHQPSETAKPAIVLAREYWRLTANFEYGLDLSGPAEATDLDIVVGELIQQHEERKWLKRQCRSKVLARLPGDGPDQWSVFKTKYTPEFGARLRERYGAEIHIANENLNSPPSRGKGGK